MQGRVIGWRQKLEDGTCYNGKTPRSASATKVSQLTGNRRFSKGKTLFGFDKARTVIPAKIRLW